MHIITSYLFKDTVKPTLVAVFILLSIVWLMQSLRFMDLIINKGLDISTFLWITMLIIPSLLLVILPLSLFAGTCYSFKRLNDDNELPPLLSAGLDRRRIVAPALQAAFLATLLGYVLSLWLVPAGMSAFKNLQHDIRETSVNLLIEEGAFNEIGSDMMVYVKERVGNNGLRTLIVHDTRNPESPVTWMAKEGHVYFTQEGYPRLVLRNGIRQNVQVDSLSVLEFEEHTINILRQFKQKEVRFKGREERYLGELMNTEGINDAEKEKFKAEFQKRLVWPFSPIPFVLIAAIFLIRSRQRRLGTFRMAAYAYMGILAYQIALMLLTNMVSQGVQFAYYAEWALPAFVTIVCINMLTSKKQKEQTV